MIILLGILIACAIVVIGFLLGNMFGIIILLPIILVAFGGYKIMNRNLSDQSSDNFFLIGFWVVTGSIIFGIIAGFLAQLIKIA